METFEVIKWPLLACLLLPWLLVYYGLHIVRRGVIFVDLALAQCAALGTAVALYLGYEVHDWQSYALSLAATVIGAAIFSLTRTHDRRVPQEALIGIAYIVAAAAGILILSKSAGGKEELQRSLVGELLVVTPREILQTAALYAVIGAVHFGFRRKFLALSFEGSHSALSGASAWGWDFLFYALFGLVVTNFVHIGGILLTFSYLIIPAVCASYLAESLRRRLLVGWIIATVAGMAGLQAAVQLDVPIGAALVCALGLALLLVMIGTLRLRSRLREGRNGTLQKAEKLVDTRGRLIGGPTVQFTHGERHECQSHEKTLGRR
jgi:zinc/manganese transport system permease protein